MSQDLVEVLERFRRGAEILAVVLTGLGPEEADFVPDGGGWSIRQVMAHLADAEVVGAYRFRLLVAEDNPRIMAFDQDAWARNLDYARRKPAQSLDSFRRARAENYELLKDLAPAAWDRAGIHSELGAVTVRGLLETYADHAVGHARQLQRLRDEYKKAKGKK
ncbi:MAG: DinB family protein [Bryobacteraceae bacterium]